MKPQLDINRRDFVRMSALATGAALIPNLASAETAVLDEVVLPKLDYGYDALEPYIDAKTMGIHHSKHHAACIAKLKEVFAVLQGDAPKLVVWESMLAGLPDVSDTAQRATIRNNGGGHWNHSFFWKSMAPADKAGKPSDLLGSALQSQFSSKEDFKKAFSQAAATRFGSGWAWLIVKDGKLKITSTPNQDNPLMKGLVDDIGTPILGLDVWEHAYYLHYQNRRADYITAWWNVVNWDTVSKRYAAATS